MEIPIRASAAKRKRNATTRVIQVQGCAFEPMNQQRAVATEESVCGGTPAHRREDQQSPAHERQSARPGLKAKMVFPFQSYHALVSIPSFRSLVRTFKDARFATAGASNVKSVRVAGIAADVRIADGDAVYAARAPGTFRQRRHRLNSAFSSAGRGGFIFAGRRHYIKL